MNVVDVKRVREANLDQVEFISRTAFADHKEARSILRHYIDKSHGAFVGFIHERSVCIYGYWMTTILSQRAYIWLLTTAEVDENKFIFVRHSQLVMEALLEKYETVIGETAINDNRAVKWLKWLGAEYFEPQGGSIPFAITKANFEKRRWIQSV